VTAGDGRGRPPGEERPQSVSDDRNSVPQQIRRRREAAQRSAPLPSGERDPLDSLALPKVKVATIRVDGRAMFVTGSYGLRDLLRAFGFKPIWATRTRAWMLDAATLPDVEAALEFSGYRVTVRGAA